MKINNTFKIVIIIVIIVFISCTKIINLRLDTQPSQIVVEANLSDSGNLVKLTRTLNFYDTSDYLTVSGAMITIEEADNGQLFILDEIRPGFYRNKFLIGKIGKTYNLKILVDNYIITSQETMTPKVFIDSIIITKLNFFGVNQYFLRPQYTDPPTSGNYYQFVGYKNDTLLNPLTYWNNDFNKGGVSTRPINNSDTTIKKNDKITIELRRITQSFFKFLGGLDATKNAQIRPDNPITNLKINSGQVFGAFTVYTSSFKSVKVTE